MTTATLHRTDERKGAESRSTTPPYTWPRTTWAALLSLLTLATLLIHGFHPFAEDGGLYAAGIEYTLQPTLFPHDTAFVTEHLRFSLFAPTLALLVRSTHVSLPAALLLCDLLTAVGTLAAARALLRRCTGSELAQLAGLALLAAGWTLPIAGTSLYLMDPYVTARSFAMPLCVLAVAYALDDRRPLSLRSIDKHSGLRCALCLLGAIAFHPLMAGFGLLLVAGVRAGAMHRSLRAWIGLTVAMLLGCTVLLASAPAESAAEHAAILTRYYWFLSEWHWYEWMGLLGPFVMMPLSLRLSRGHAPRAWPALVRGALGSAMLCFLCGLLFARESAATHAVARLQPLRVFVLVYALMLLLLGAGLYERCAHMAAGKPTFSRAALHAMPALACLGMATGMFAAGRATYPTSPHVELPWAPPGRQNAWVQAFLWAREQTPPDALFAMDARYVNLGGEDAQTFRAWSLRSALPDYSKDGGEASITPSLAPVWLDAASAQAGLSRLNDAERDRRLQPFGVTWMVLQSSAVTTHPCPYRNAVVKLCRLSSCSLSGVVAPQDADSSATLRNDKQGRLHLNANCSSCRAPALPTPSRPSPALASG